MAMKDVNCSIARTEIVIVSCADVICKKIMCSAAYLAITITITSILMITDNLDIKNI